MSNPTTIDSTDIQQEFGAGTGEAEMARRLLALNRAPRPALVARVRAMPGAAHAQAGRTLGRRLPRLAWAMIAVTLLLVGMVGVSPPLRAALGVIPDKIGEIYLNITDRLPDSGQVVVHDYTWVAPDQAPFQFSLPQYVPDGWTMEDMIGINHLRGAGMNDVLVRWAGPGHSPIFMSVYPLTGEPPATLIGAGSYREIEINGQSAVIMRGGWDSDTGEWSHPDVTTVLWTVDKLQYELWSTEPDISEAELVRMAGSVP